MVRVFFSLCLCLGTMMSLPAHALTVTLYKPNGVAAFSQFMDSQTAVRNVLQISISEFRLNSDYSYASDDKNLVQINGVGNKSVQYSLNEIRNYGWCYTLNGTNTDVNAVDAKPSSGSDEIAWFYGYASQVNGEWKVGCYADNPDLQAAVNGMRSRHIH